MSLSLRAANQGRVTVIHCNGRIVSGNEAASLESEVRSALDLTPAVILNLAEVSFIDSSGLGLLVRLHTAARTSWRSFVLCGANDAIRKVFALTNLDSVFCLQNTEAEAIAAAEALAPVPRPASSLGTFILCVHGSLNLLASIRESLSRAGHDVNITDNIEDALVMLERHRPRLLIASPRALSTLAPRARQLEVPVIPLDDDFARSEAGEAFTDLLTKVSAQL